MWLIFVSEQIWTIKNETLVLKIFIALLMFLEDKGGGQSSGIQGECDGAGTESTAAVTMEFNMFFSLY